MTSHLQVEYHQHYSIFSINQLSNCVDCDVINIIKKLIVIIRRKVVRTPSEEYIKQYAYIDVSDLSYVYRDGIKWDLLVHKITLHTVAKTTIYYNSIGEIKIVTHMLNMSPLANDINRDVRLFLQTNDINHYVLSTDQNLIMGDDEFGIWTEYLGALIFVEK